MKRHAIFVVLGLMIGVGTMLQAAHAFGLPNARNSVASRSYPKADGEFSTLTTQNSPSQSTSPPAKKRLHKSRFKVIAIIGLTVFVVGVCIAVL